MLTVVCTNHFLSLSLGCEPLQLFDAEQFSAPLRVTFRVRSLAPSLPSYVDKELCLAAFLSA